MLNNSYEELVRKYKKYQKQKIVKVLFFISILFVFIGFLLYFFNIFIKTEQQITNANEKNVTKEDLNKTEPIDQNIQKEPIKESVKNEPIQKNNQKAKENIIQKKTQAQKEHHVEKNVAKTTQQNTQENSFKLEVTQRKELVKLLKEYELKKDFSSSMNLANYYLNHERYQQAIKWAIKSSKLDPSASEPWILYAKAKHQQGKTKVAIKALNIYLKRYKSKEAQDLLDTLKNTN